MDLTPRIEDGRLILPRCPHCGIASPLFTPAHAGSTTKEFSQDGGVSWSVHRCQTCGLPTTILMQRGNPGYIARVLPGAQEPNKELPERARTYLSQAIDSATLAPSGTITLCASAVDAMLKSKDYKKGDLYPRIEQAAKDHLITASMAKWAHEVRLDANIERHADEKYELPTKADARRSVEFVIALGEYLFVLPARIAKGREAAKSGGQDQAAPTK